MQVRDVADEILCASLPYLDFIFWCGNLLKTLVQSFLLASFDELFVFGE